MLNNLRRDIARRFNLESSTVTSLVSGLLAVMTDEQTGGIEGFIARFRAARLGSSMDAWVGGFSARPLSESQTRKALGRETIDDLADAAGLGRGATVAVLAYLIPRLVDEVTSGGRVPTTPELRRRVARLLEHHDKSAHPVPGRIRSARQPRRTLMAAALVAVPVMAVAGWFLLSPTVPSESGTAPELAVRNSGDAVIYTGQVRDEDARATIVEALNSTFGEERVSGEVSVDGEVQEADWVQRVEALMSALDTPGAEFTLTGDSARVGGRLTEVERTSVAERVRGALGESIAVTAEE